jgi:hypothetical protein
MSNKRPTRKFIRRIARFLKWFLGLVLLVLEIMDKLKDLLM